MFKKVIGTIALTLAICASMGITAFAGNTFSSYNTTVGRFNGNGYTGYQKKATDGANGYLKSNTVGGDYTVDVRMKCSAGNGSWKRNITDKRNYSLASHYKQTKGKKVCLQFSNDLTTPVAVQVSGSWKSN